MKRIVIKVLDDQEGVRIAIQNDLQQYSVSVFADPKQFLASIDEHTDLIISDYRVENYDAISALRSVAMQFPGLKIIVISAYFSNEIFRELIRLRIDDTVEKNGGDWMHELMLAVQRLVPAIVYKKSILD